MMTMSSAAPGLFGAPVVRPVTEGGRRILDLVLKSGGLTQARITRALDLAQPTVNRLLVGFAQDGLVRMSPRPGEGPGKPSMQVTLNPDFAYSLGVSLMGDVVSMALMDFAGQVRGVRHASMPVMSRSAVLARLVEFRDALIAEAGVDPRRLIGMGVGMSAFFVEEPGWMNPPAYLDDWALVDVAPILQAAFGMPVTVENDASAAAIGESLFGVGRTCADFVYLHLTNGFGGGIISGGKLFRGRHGNAGEFGGIWTLAELGYPNLDLLRTCLADAGGRFETVEDMVRSISLETPGVDAWLERAERPFSVLCGMLAYAFDPQLVVIGGRLPATIAQALAARISVPRAPNPRGRPPPSPTVVVTQLTQDAVALGAAAMPLQTAFFA